jgi:hypothetical protein
MKDQFFFFFSLLINLSWNYLIPYLYHLWLKYQLVLLMLEDQFWVLNAMIEKSQLLGFQLKEDFE